jgi:DNA-binding NtrC family response regulator
MARRVFVVDDEKVISDTLCAILRLHDFDARAFYDAQSALAACEASPPEIVISDVGMAGMNGIEMAIRIRGRMPSCQILLFSGQSSSQSLLETAKLGGYVFDFLMKPLNPADLLAKLKTGG